MNNHLLILDLDETLIHSTDGLTIHSRPYLDEFLGYALSNFRLAVWTAGGALYADRVIEYIGLKDKLEFVFSNKRCTLRGYDHYTQEQIYLKDLKKVKRLGYDLKQVLMVDDTRRNLARHYGNLIPITPWVGGEDDKLLVLFKFLERIKDHSNYRSIEKRFWYSQETHRQNPKPSV